MVVSSVLVNGELVQRLPESDRTSNGLGSRTTGEVSFS